MSGAAERALAAYVGAFVDELARAGVRHACVAPGSRSTPLALALARHPAVRVWMHLDERSAAFFALGMAKRSGAPVALLCTSGTAAANFLPAVAEARHARVPLVVLTADRPPELRDVGAAQTIDQTRLYGSHAKWFVDVALPEASPALLRYVRTLAGRAAAVAAAAPAGPVHLNFPFREPLVPAWDEAGDADAGELVADGAPPDVRAGRPDGEPWVRVTPSAGAPAAETAARLAALLRSAARPVVVCGPQPDPTLAAPLARLAALAGAPLLADPLSQLRWGAHGREPVMDAYDAFLRVDEVAAALGPDLVLRLGAAPTSKPVLTWLQRHEGARLVVVDAAWPDPTHLAAEVVQGEPRAVCEAVVAALAADEGGEHPGAANGVAEDGRVRRGGPPTRNIAETVGTAAIESSPPSASARGHASSDAGRGAPPTGNIRGAATAGVIDRTHASSPARSTASPDGAPSGTAWLTRWRALDAAARAALDDHADGLDEPFEGRVLRDVARALPDGATLWVSSSMPVRDLDAFARGDGRRLRVLANRGANGIDGVVSSALGAAAVAAESGDGPLVLVVGDLAFYHDMNGLLAARLHALDATVVLVNNDGGGIFSFLPQAAQPAHFERLFGTPHGLDFRHAAALYEAHHEPVARPADVGPAVGAALGRRGLDVLEVRTERARNVALHREAWEAVARATRRALDEGDDARPGAGVGEQRGGELGERAGGPGDDAGDSAASDDAARSTDAARSNDAARDATMAPAGDR